MVPSIILNVVLGAILRMFERVLGSDRFFKALNSYLIKNQYGNAEADTLIDEFVAVIDKPLCGKMDARKIFDSFLKNTHYPVGKLKFLIV